MKAQIWLKTARAILSRPSNISTSNPGAGVYCRSCCRQRRFVSTNGAGVLVFDRESKRKQRDWAVKQPEFPLAAYLKEEIGYRVADRVYDLTDFMPLAIDLGSGAGFIAPHVFKEHVGHLIQVEMSPEMLTQAKISDEVHTSKLCADEELVPFGENSVDLILSGCSAHWINDLPAFIRRCYTALRPDGCLIATMLGGETLYQLRVSLQLAENERKGGVGAHISPLTQTQDITALLSWAGFQMVTLDADEMVVDYPDPFSLMVDLQLMAESNCAYNRPLTISRDVLLAAAAIYDQMYGRIETYNGNGPRRAYPASFQMISFVGWKPGPKLPKAAKRGSQTVSFKDLDKITEQMAGGAEDERKTKVGE